MTPGRPSALYKELSAVRRLVSSNRQSPLTNEYTRGHAAFYRYMGTHRRKRYPAVSSLALLAGIGLLLDGWAGAQAGTSPATARHKLTVPHERRLLAFVAQARSDSATDRDEAVLTELSEFRSYVQSLRRSGSIDGATASILMPRARITASLSAARPQTGPPPPTDRASPAQTLTATTQTAGN